MAEELIGRHVFHFNPQENGGEALFLETDFFDNGDGEVFTNQKIKLYSYSNSASINLLGGTALTPENLRELANQLERNMNLVLNDIGIAKKQHAAVVEE